MLTTTAGGSAGHGYACSPATPVLNVAKGRITPPLATSPVSCEHAPGAVAAPDDGAQPFPAHTRLGKNALQTDNAVSSTVRASHAEAVAPEPVHPLGGKARVLLCSVFGPYARDDEFGSRAINPMELYHNQVTRVQGPFSLRMFHRSWGLMLIQANIAAPCTLLDFPTLDRFIEEVQTHRYDVVGISSIMPNVGKVAHMTRLIREHLPEATVVVGGHIANLPGVYEKTGADYVVRGEGVRWMRRYLGERTDRPIRHPHIRSGIGARAMGVNLSRKPRDIAATLIPSVGCPMGCNFCATSAMFGGKGKFINFFETGDELFDVMVELERSMKVRSFFVMDENFLLHKPRALRLLELMQQHRKAWALYVFSSANVLRSYTIDQLVGLGVSWVWMGLEGESSQYVKLKDADTRRLVRELQGHGVRVLGSSIIGLEEHTPDNIDAAIDYAVSHDTEFHQFMLYTPIPGTPLWQQLEADQQLTDPDCTDVADIHGQIKFAHRHAHLAPDSEGEILLRAFQRDFDVNGPSVIRIARTTLEGWRRYRHCRDRRVRARFRWEAASLATTQAGALWAARAWFADRPELRARLDGVLREVYATCGLRARLAAPIIGRYLLGRIRAEADRLVAGWTYEPPTFYEHKPAAAPAPAPRKTPVGCWVPPVGRPAMH